jgi:hypothetical protein
VLFDPFKEKFYLPAALVKFSDSQGIELKVVGQEYEALVGVGIDILDTSQDLRIFHGSVVTCKHDSLVATESRGFVHSVALLRTELHVLFCASDEESHARLKAEESGKIDIASIHDVVSARFDREVIESFDIVHFSVGNMDKTGNVATQIDQSMKLDSCFASAKLRPREEGQTKIDGGGIEGVNGLI